MLNDFLIWVQVLLYQFVTTIPIIIVIVALLYFVVKKAVVKALEVYFGNSK